jgi:protein-S-isoprenylcysteine O-methyltransferase Ste14
MDPRIYSVPILIFFVFVLHLFGAWDLLFSWPVLVSLAVGVFLYVSQPAISPKNLKEKNPHDRRSVLVILVNGCLVFLIPVLDYRFGRQARPPIDAPWSIIGLALTFVSIAFRYWAIRTLGKFFTSVVMVQEGQRVIQSGPFRYLRHPSYLGSFLMSVGISVFFRSYAGLVFCLIGFFAAYVYRISVEEKTLLAEFGEEYVLYRKRTWRMIPFVY